MNIYLVRHGEKSKDLVLNEDGFPDMELTNLGKEQARKTGKYFANIKLDAIYSSDLIRAYDTAKYIEQAQEKSMPIIKDKRIREINMGEFHTSSENEIKSKYSEFYRLYIKKEADFRYPNGETGEELKIRTIDFIKSLTNKNLDNICVVCHGGVIHSIISYYLELPIYKRFNIFPDNCGVSKIKISEESFRVINVNETYHLI